MSGTETNRATAIRYVTEMRDHDGVMDALVTDDCQWYLPGVATVGKEQFRMMIAPLKPLMDGFPRITVLGTTAEGDRVALECTGSARLTAGGSYDNVYHFLLEFRDGLICRISEYTDTKYAAEIFSDL